MLTRLADTGVHESFYREIAIVASLRHRNIVSIYELGEYGGLPFCAMEDPAYDDLRRVITLRTPLTLLQKVLIMSEIVNGAQAAHGAGLIPLVIRPSGLALGRDGTVIIRNFGVVSALSEQFDEDYKSPEEFDQGFVPDELSDIFMFGIVCYELLAGTHPFSTEDYGERRIDILRQEARPLRDLVPDCPECLERLVHRALNKSRQLRYQTFEAIQEDAAAIVWDLKRARVGQRIAEARCWIGREELDDAENAVHEVLELEPANPIARRLRKSVQAQLARRTLRSQVGNLVLQADAAAQAGDFGRSMQLLESASRLDANNSEIMSRLGIMYLRLERDRPVRFSVTPRRALDSLQEPDGAELAIPQRQLPESNPADEEGDFYNRGREKARLLLGQGQPEQAADLLRNLLSLFPDDAVLQSDLQATQGSREQTAARLQ